MTIHGQKKKHKEHKWSLNLVFFSFEEQSCLILDSISNPVFIIQILDFNCRFLILGLPWTEWT